MPRIGQIVLYSCIDMRVVEPAIITAVHTDGIVNLVKFQGNALLIPHNSVGQGNDPGQWQPLEEEEAAAEETQEGTQ